MFPPSRSVSGTSGSGGVNVGGRKALPRATDFSFSNVGLSQQAADSIWLALKRAVEEILQGNNAQLRFEELYRNAYTLVLHKHGDMLYRGVEECITRRMVRVANEVARASDASLLDSLVSAWEDHKLKMTMLKDILMYMDKTYCKNSQLQPVYEKGLLLFRDHVVRATNMSYRLKTIMLENVRAERTGEVIDGVLLKNSCLLLLEVNLHNPELYNVAFERDLLTTSRTFYSAESQGFIASNTVADYMLQAERRILEEEARADRYFDKSTKQKLRTILQEELIQKYSKRLVDDASGAVFLLKQGHVQDMARMYSLFQRVPECLDDVREAMFTLVKQAGTAIVSDKEHQRIPRLFVEKVLECRTHYMQFITHSFKSDRSFAKVLKEALEYFINLDTRAAQYLSLYLDDLLRKQSSSSGATSGASSGGGLHLSDLELDARLNDIMSIFRYLSDKDIFEEFYKQHLSQRLLENTSSNSEIERLMISKLKADCGHQFTSRLEGMFKDMELSKQIMVQWREGQSGQLPVGCELCVSVLTTGFWPLPSIPQCILPTEAREATEAFKRYYMSQHSGRKLTWQTALGQAELRCTFEGGKKELVVHTYQMCILMLFNHGDKLSFADIQTQTGIPPAELTRHLLSLAHPQVKILLKNPPGKALAPDHRFKYNTKYASKLYRNKISVLSKAAAGVGGDASGAGGDMSDATGTGGSSASSSGSIPESVQESRKYSVEASIVRIMKSRKTLDHNLLVSEVIRQLGSKFPVEPAFIKKRIEALIEREYIERDQNNRRIYNYKA